jgi:hypothetical protein
MPVVLAASTDTTNADPREPNDPLPELLLKRTPADVKPQRVGVNWVRATTQVGQWPKAGRALREARDSGRGGRNRRRARNPTAADACSSSQPAPGPLGGPRCALRVAGRVVDA